jgi:spore germination protein KB
MELDNLRPVLYEGVTPLLKGAVTAFFFPFTETMIFLMVFNSFSSKKSPYKIYSISSIIAGLIIAAVSARNIMAAGIEVTSKYYFPSFIVVSRINIGDFLQRIELIVMVVIILSVYVKISCCLLAASKCVSKILGFKDYRFIISPVALLIIGISFKLFENMQEAIGWVQLYMPINNFIFTICVVLFTYLRSEFYHRKNFSKQRN